MTTAARMFPYEKRKCESTFNEALSISVDDIYQMAERERLKYNVDNRRIALEMAQNTIHRMDNIPSRPNTSASRYIELMQRDITTPKSIRSEPPPSRASTSCGDHGPDDNENTHEIDDVFTRLIQGSNAALCNVIDPTMCGEYRKTQYRYIGKERNKVEFSNINIADENITTAILKRYFPTLSDTEIKKKLSEGQIARSMLPKLIQNKRERDVKSDVKRTNKRPNTNTLPKQKTLFFSNLRDLNTQIVTGKASRRLTTTTSADNAIPAFKSTRKVQLMPKPVYQMFYDPPLLAKENQVNEPSFFAGCDDAYNLPNRLPEEIVFVDKNNGLLQATEEPESPDCTLLEDPLRVEVSYFNPSNGVEKFGRF